MARPIEIGNEAQVTAAQAEEARVSRFRSLLSEFRRDIRWWFGVVLLLFTLAAIFAPQVSPYNPLTYHPSIVEQPPSWSHLLDTDSLGRDQLSRVIYGARISLSIGVISILMGGLAGTILGMLAAYFKGWVDQLVITVTDALLAFPSLIL